MQLRTYRVPLSVFSQIFQTFLHLHVWFLILFGKSFSFLPPHAESILSLNTVLSDFIEASFHCSRGLVYFPETKFTVLLKSENKNHSNHSQAQNHLPICILFFSCSSQYAFLVVTLGSVLPSGIFLFQFTKLFPPKSINPKSYIT